MRGAEFSAPRLLAEEWGEGGRRGRPVAHHRARDQQGIVTVEIALGFITCAMLLATLAGVVLLGVSQSAIQVVSLDLARSLARGDEAAAQRVRDAAPAEATIEVQRQPDGVRVVTQQEISVFRLGKIKLRASAWAVWEPGVEP